MVVGHLDDVTRPGRDEAVLEGGRTDVEDEDLHRVTVVRATMPGEVPDRLIAIDAPEGPPMQPGAGTSLDPPGSIHEGGELGYSLSHAYGAVLDNPELVAVCVVGDGEAETGPLAASWHSNKFLDPAGDGAVLPILHLNGYKIANPTVLARI